MKKADITAVCKAGPAGPVIDYWIYRVRRLQASGPVGSRRGLQRYRLLGTGMIRAEAVLVRGKL